MSAKRSPRQRSRIVQDNEVCIPAVCCCNMVCNERGQSILPNIADGKFRCGTSPIPWNFPHSLWTWDFLRIASGTDTSLIVQYCGLGRCFLFRLRLQYRTKQEIMHNVVLRYITSRIASANHVTEDVQCFVRGFHTKFLLVTRPPTKV